MTDDEALAQMGDANSNRFFNCLNGAKASVTEDAHARIWREHAAEVAKNMSARNLGWSCPCGAYEAGATVPPLSHQCAHVLEASRRKAREMNPAAAHVLGAPADFKMARAFLMGDPGTLLGPSPSAADTSARRFTRDEVLTVLKAHITTLDPKGGGPSAVRDLMHIFERME